ncbi:DUF3102 domain-containing protein [Bacillus cereus]|nr:DUF3102 domain-containing protein [Bacillus cereus]MBJ8037609.1 DUF3102 domain-containing protein [Bacillus cereus]
MNEITNLSTDINVITAEIKSYQQIAGQSIFEIGKRLKYVKENDLVRGEFGGWLETNFDMNKRTAQRFIQAFEQLVNTTTSSHLHSGKIFEIISLPQEIDRQQFIEEPHTIPSTVEESTFSLCMVSLFFAGLAGFIYVMDWIDKRWMKDVEK